MYYTRNSDLNYYNAHPSAANCGSYALRLNEWYDPEDYFIVTEGDIYEWAESMGEAGYNDYEMSNIYADILLEGIMEEFNGELEFCDGRAPSTSDKELIAFNTFCYWHGDYSADIDFHFRVYRDGKWSEKCGHNDVRDCDIDDWGRYIGEPVYMYHRIDMKGADDEQKRPHKRID